MSRSRDNERQNVTISLTRRVLKKAKALAARRGTSISGLLAQQIESLVGKEGPMSAPSAKLWPSSKQDFTWADE